MEVLPVIHPAFRPIVSQRFLISLIGIILIQISWRWSVAHLYTLPTEAIAGFVSITTNTLYITGAIVIFMVTGRLVYDWKLGTNQVQEVASSVEQLTEKLTKNSKEDGYEASI
jgi:hypothetical protein